MRRVCSPLLALAALSMTGCTSIYDEVCNDYDGRPESVRGRVLGGFTLPPSAQVIDCQWNQIDYLGDDESCLISLDPADFESTFPAGRFGPDRSPAERRPAAATPQSLARTHGVTLDWVRYKTEYSYGAAIFSNHARDRVVVYVTHDRCHAPAEVMSFSGTR